MNWFNRPQCLPNHEWLRAFVPVLRRALLNPEPVVARVLKIAEDIERHEKGEAACQCGHHRNAHTCGRGMCWESMNGRFCDCNEYQSTEAP